MEIRRKYRPFVADADMDDWVGKLELSTVMKMAEQDLGRTGERLKVLVLFGGLRRRLVALCVHEAFTRCSYEHDRSYSRLVALEASRILFRLGCDVRVYDPTDLSVKDDARHQHEKVQELRGLSEWSDGHIWVSPEQHGNLSRGFFHLSSTPSLKVPWSAASNPDGWALICDPTDWSLQGSDRLDLTFHRQCTTHSRPYPRHRASLRRFAILQRRQFPTHPGSLDAHVHNPKSIFDPKGLHTVHKRQRR